MSRAVHLRVLSQQVLVVGEELRDYQVVELLDADDRRTALFSRHLNAEGTKWIRHGLFQSFHENGSLESEGSYRHGAEHGPWRDLYDNGVVAASGSYYRGEHVGLWSYCAPSGNREAPDHYPSAPGPFES